MALRNAGVIGHHVTWRSGQAESLRRDRAFSPPKWYMVASGKSYKYFYWVNQFSPTTLTPKLIVLLQAASTRTLGRWCNTPETTAQTSERLWLQKRTWHATGWRLEPTLNAQAGGNYGEGNNCMHCCAGSQLGLRAGSCVHLCLHAYVRLSVCRFYLHARIYVRVCICTCISFKNIYGCLYI